MRAVVTIKLRVHLVNNSPYLNLASLESIVDGMNAIWRDANVHFALEGNPDNIIESAWPNLSEIADTFQPSADGTIYGLYGHYEGDPNGWSCPTKRLYFVRDFSYLYPWTPPLLRVSSHEIGHILGLDHYRTPKGYLMTSNDPGTAFQQFEVIKSYRNAHHIAGLAPP